MTQAIAVGDSSNDLAMIRAAGLGVGVANVTDDVRPYCDVVLETAREPTGRSPRSSRDSSNLSARNHGVLHFVDLS